VPKLFVSAPTPGTTFKNFRLRLQLGRLTNFVVFFFVEDQTLLFEETEAEVNSQRQEVEELVAFGRELVKGRHNYAHVAAPSCHLAH
jgi:hypothetical protein